jgi:hypothetical protein
LADKSYSTRLDEAERSLIMPGIVRVSSTGANLVFCGRFYNLDKIRGLSYLAINRVYRR